MEWLGRKVVRSNTDRTRMLKLTRIAEDALDLVLIRNPSTPVDTLVRAVIAHLRQAGVTKSDAVMERVAAAAVARRRSAFYGDKAP